MAQSPKDPVRPAIMVADGNAQRRLTVATILAPFYDVHRHGDRSQALAGFHEVRPAAAVIGDELPDSDGFDLVRMLRLDAKFAKTPVAMIVGTSGPATTRRVRQAGAQCCLPETCSAESLIATVSRLLNKAVEESWAGLAPLQRQALTQTSNVFSSLSSLIGDGGTIPYGTIADACQPLVACVATDTYEQVMNGVRSYDDYTYAHSLRVATLLSLFGSHLGLTQPEQVVVASGGLVHDVGKIAIPRSTLNKAGKLTEEEWAVMRGHVPATEAYLRRFPDLPRGIMTIAAQHHEKLDGSGYPRGLKGAQLDFLARMAAVVDVFSALTDRRVYRAPMPPEAALKLMMTQMAAELDMTLLRMFRELMLDTIRSAGQPERRTEARPAMPVAAR